MYPHLNKYDQVNIFQFQVIISSSWVCAFIITIPPFLAVEIKKERSSNFCGYTWPERWMEEAYGWTWLVFITPPLVLMIGLYSRIVYTLWFKRNDDNSLTHQQRVSVLPFFLCSAGIMPVRTLCRQMKSNVLNNRMKSLQCNV